MRKLFFKALCAVIALAMLSPAAALADGVLRRPSALSKAFVSNIG